MVSKHIKISLTSKVSYFTDTLRLSAKTIILSLQLQIQERFLVALICEIFNLFDDVRRTKMPPQQDFFGLSFIDPV